MDESEATMVTVPGSIQRSTCFTTGTTERRDHNSFELQSVAMFQGEGNLVRLSVIILQFKAVIDIIPGNPLFQSLASHHTCDYTFIWLDYKDLRPSEVDPKCLKQSEQDVTMRGVKVSDAEIVQVTPSKHFGMRLRTRSLTGTFPISIS